MKKATSCKKSKIRHSDRKKVHTSFPSSLRSVIYPTYAMPISTGEPRPVRRMTKVDQLVISRWNALE